MKNEQAMRIVISNLGEITARQFDPDRTTITGYSELKKLVDQCHSLINESVTLKNKITEVEAKLSDLVATGAVVFKSDTHSTTETEETEPVETEEPVDDFDDESDEPVDSDVDNDEEPESEPETIQEPEPEDESKPEPKLIPIPDDGKPINWVPIIPTDKYMVLKSGKVINRYTGKPVFPIPAGDGMYIKLVGNTRTGRQNPTVVKIKLTTLMNSAFPEMMRAPIKTGTGRVSIESVTKPVTIDDDNATATPSPAPAPAPTSTTESGFTPPPCIVNMDTIGDDWRYIDFIDGIPTDKYKINKHLRVVNTYTNRSVGRSERRGVLKCNLNSSRFGRGENKGYGVSGCVAVNLTTVGIIRFLTKTDLPLDELYKKLVGRRLVKLDATKPWALDNVDLHIVEDVL
jgi:hypothetical protein